MQERLRFVAVVCFLFAGGGCTDRGAASDGSGGGGDQSGSSSDASSDGSADDGGDDSGSASDGLSDSTSDGLTGGTDATDTNSAATDETTTGSGVGTFTSSSSDSGESTSATTATDTGGGDPCAGPDVHVGSEAVYSDAELTALEGIRCIDGDLEIYGPVANVTPLWALERVTGGLTVASDGLATLDGLENLEVVGGGLFIGGSDLTSIAALGALLEVEHLTISGTKISNVDALLGLRRLSSLTIGAWIDDPSAGNQNLQDLDGLANVAVIDGASLSIKHNDALASLAGLASAGGFSGSLRIAHNAALPSIGPLAGIGSPTAVDVYRNPLLPTCDVLSFVDGLPDSPATFVAFNGPDACDDGNDCVPMDAMAVGICSSDVGYIWDGSACSHESGCTCEGTECSPVWLWTTEDACLAVFAGC